MNRSLGWGARDGLRRFFLLLPILIACHAGAGAEQAGPLADGEVAWVHFDAFLGDRFLVATSREETSGDPAIPKMAWYSPPAEFGPLTAVVGAPCPFPGLGESLAGMRAGERKRITLAPEAAFGPRDSALVEDYPRVRRLPRRTALSAREFVERFQIFPLVGHRFAYDSYVDAEILSVTPREATLELHPHEPAVTETPLGATQVESGEDEIRIIFHPRVGASWRDPDGRRGTIAAVGAETFSVDFNHRLAGRPVTLEIEVLGRASRDSLQAAAYPWLEDHDAALALARSERRPVFLLLYATWCAWSQKLLDETMEDPRVKTFMDRFVWVRVASDIHRDIRERYQQMGSPLIVLIDETGQVNTRFEGYREAEPLCALLQGCLTDW
ncbi:MAG: thioredoxin family protein [Candidatus Eisenbacteria bacterium]